MTDTTAPSTSSTNNEIILRDRILALAQSRPNGITDKDMQTELPDVNIRERANIINKLLSQGMFDLFKKDGMLLYKLKDPKKAIVKGADNEEKIIYKIIEEAGNKGIWIRDIRFKSNLNMMQLNKILKSLETKKLIKAVKSVSASKKKVYMLYNLEPDSTITGGAWYQDQDFESEFVELLNQQCYRYLLQKRQDADKNIVSPYAVRNKSYASIQDIHKYISDSGISNIKLSTDDIDMIMYTVVLDGKAEQKLAVDGTKMYRAIESLLPPPSLVSTPCGLCPVIHRCSDIGLVNPKACNYMTEWLD